MCSLSLSLFTPTLRQKCSIIINIEFLSTKRAFLKEYELGQSKKKKKSTKIEDDLHHEKGLTISLQPMWQL